MRPMPITELLQRVGADHVGVQPLFPAIVNIQRRKDGLNRVTFLTDAITPELLMEEQASKCLLLLVIDQPLVCAAVAAHDAGDPLPSPPVQTHEEKGARGPGVPGVGQGDLPRQSQRGLSE